MQKTANSIIRQSTWTPFSSAAPEGIAKRFKKVLIDCDVTPRQAFLAFMHAVGTGQLRIEAKPECKEYRGRGLVFDGTGVFDDYRAILKTQDGRVINPLPYSNDFVEKI